MADADVLALIQAAACTLQEIGRVWPFTSRHITVWVGGFWVSGAWASAAPVERANAAAARAKVRIMRGLLASRQSSAKVP
jgi:hypothetical protein